jgi:hypothetical protein
MTKEQRIRQIMREERARTLTVAAETRESFCEDALGDFEALQSGVIDYHINGVDRIDEIAVLPTALTLLLDEGQRVTDRLEAEGLRRPLGKSRNSSRPRLRKSKPRSSR